jgi:flagellin
VVPGTVRDDFMALLFGSNLVASSIISAINKTNSKVPLLYRRLVTGSVVGNGADTGVALTLTEQLRTQSRLATVAIQNATDAISVVSTADSALQSIGDVLTRMAELALQGSNSTYSETQTSAIQLEFDALGSEIQRISSSANFNSISLLSSGGNLSIQVGITNNAQAAITVASLVATIAALGLGNNDGSLTYSVSGSSTEQSVSASLLAYSAVIQAQNSVLLQRGSRRDCQGRLI